MRVQINRAFTDVPRVFNEPPHFSRMNPFRRGRTLSRQFTDGYERHWTTYLCFLTQAFLFFRFCSNVHFRCRVKIVSLTWILGPRLLQYFLSFWCIRNITRAKQIINLSLLRYTDVLKKKTNHCVWSLSLWSVNQLLAQEVKRHEI